MIKVSVLYPNANGATFNYEYYLNKHMALVKDRFGPNLLSYSVDKGVVGDNGGTQPLYVTQCNLYFESMHSLAAVMTDHGGELNADVPNFTNITPVTQVSEVLVDTRGA